MTYDNDYFYHPDLVAFFVVEEDKRFWWNFGVPVVIDQATPWESYFGSFFFFSLLLQLMLQFYYFLVSSQISLALNSKMESSITASFILTFAQTDKKRKKLTLLLHTWYYTSICLAQLSNGVGAIYHHQLLANCLLDRAIMKRSFYCIVQDRKSVV